MEILSPNNRDHDLIRKKNLYEQFGVNEYWIVDPGDKSTRVYKLAEDPYRLIFEDVGLIQSHLLNSTFAF